MRKGTDAMFLIALCVAAMAVEMAGAPTPTAAQSPQPLRSVCTRGEYYTVKRGDTLEGLAKAWGVSVDDLKGINHLVGDTLWVGQALLAPCSAPLLAEGATAQPSRTVSSAHCAPYYVVRPGDTLETIAQQCGVSVSTLKQINQKRGDQILVGQVLRLPQP